MWVMRGAETVERLARLEEEFSGTIGVAAQGLKDLAMPPVLWREQLIFPAASVIKVPLLYACLRQVDRGLLALDQRFTLHSADQVPGSGVLRDLTPGLRLTLHDLLMLMTIVSDNTATNMVIDALGGVDIVNHEMAMLGLYKTRLVGKLMLPKELRNEAQLRGEINRVTAEEMLRLINAIWCGEGLSERTAEAARTILRRQHYTDSLTRYLPWPPGSPYAPWEIGAKSGSITGVRNQVGWLTYQGRTFAFAVLTQGGADQRFFGENEGNIIVAKAFRIVYDHFLRP